MAVFRAESAGKLAGHCAEMVGIYEDLAAGRPVPTTEQLSPDYGRRVFPGRTVTARFDPPQ